MQRDKPQPGFLHSWPNRVQEAQFPERRVHDPLVGQALDLVEKGLAALWVDLPGLLDEEVVDVWLPTDYTPTRAYRGSAMIGRLAPGATVAQAQAELDALATAFVANHPAAYPDKRLRLWVRPLSDVVTRDARPALMASASPWASCCSSRASTSRT